MKKIPTLFQRNHDGDKPVRNEVTPGCEWVLAGEGKATTKYDGTCCMIRDGQLFKRRELKAGQTPPPDFEECDHDDTTGKRFGWVPVGDGSEDQYHREAWEHLPHDQRHDGTYELCGPKVQGNPENFSSHRLVRHGWDEWKLWGRSYEELKEQLQDIADGGYHCEGFVFHHPDGRMAKIKAKDFGIRMKR